MPAWSYAVALVASLKVAAAVLAFATSESPAAATSAEFPSWVHLTQAVVFGTLGVALFLASGTDSRAGWLGGTLLLIAAPFADAVLRRFFETADALYLGDMIRVDAFLPLFFWIFLADFPRSTMRRHDGIAKLFIVVSAAAGCVLFITHLSYVVWRPPAVDMRRLFLASAPDGYYWVVVTGLATAGLPFLLAAARRATANERRRVGVFVLGLLLGCGPISIEVLLEALVPRYRDLVTRPGPGGLVAFVIYTLLATVPFVTAYAVLVDRVVELRFVLRSALQYALARYTILLASAVPFVALGAIIFERRHESVASLLSGPRPLALIAALALGLGLLRLRGRAFDALDRRFFREQYDARQILGDLAEVSVKEATPNELGARVAHEVNRALHLHNIHLFIADENGLNLLGVDGRHRPLSCSSALGLILASDSAALDVDLADRRSPLHRLPVDERHWLSDGGFRMIVPLVGTDGRLSGALGLGDKRSGLPFSADDRRLLRALAASLTLALENRRLRSSPAQPTDAAARECLECGAVYSPDTSTCRCGGKPTTAPAPYTLRGAFRLDARIGAGGMGVVYRARDLALGRDVAIKTLPRVSPEEAARLRREARAMAALSHPNLAVIFGAETWRGTPLLVVEFLGGGTLAERLRLQPPTVAEVLDLGISLTDALEHIHRAGVLHCDIKPTNIAFTKHNVPKLLDFGLAHILRESHRRASGNDTTTTQSLRGASVGTQDGGGAWSSADTRFAGTPVYMSPEAINAHSPTPSFDIWSLNVVLYEALAGANPFAGDSKLEVYENITKVGAPDLGTFRADCPAPLAGFFRAALSRDPRERPPTAGALCRRLFDLRSMI